MVILSGLMSTKQDGCQSFNVISSGKSGIVKKLQFLFTTAMKGLFMETMQRQLATENWKTIVVVVEHNRFSKPH